MRTIISLLFMLLISTGSLKAQDTLNRLRIPLKEKMNKNVVLNLASHFTVIEGYDGTDLIIDPDPSIILPRALPAKAIGLKVIETPQVVKPADNRVKFTPIYETKYIYQATILTKCQGIKIMVPNGMRLFSATLVAEWPDALLRVKNIRGNVELDQNKGVLDVSGIIGSLYVRGDVGEFWVHDMPWDAEVANRVGSKPFPYSIFSKHADIHLSLPKNLAATLKLKAANQPVYSDRELPVTAGSDVLLNGGGVIIGLQSNYGSIFLKTED